MITVLIAFLLTFPILYLPSTAAQSNSSNPAFCEYKGNRKPATINPKTKKAYTPDERNQEPFDGGSISKDEIRQCLQANTPVKNHHILFEIYWEAWQSLAKETGDYAIPLLIEGGVLHAPYNVEANTGGIRLWKFRDPKVSHGSKLTEEERRAFRIEQKDAPIALIRSQITWQNVFIDSAVISVMEDWKFGDDTPSVIYSGAANFSESTFSGAANFLRPTFSRGAYFSGSTFSGKAIFIESTFSGVASFFDSAFSGVADLRSSTFIGEANFNRSTFSGAANFSESTFSAAVHFSESTFSGETSFFDSTFSGVAYFSHTQFKNNADFRGIIIDSDQLVFDNTTWEKRIDLRYISVKGLHWDSTQNPSDVKGVVDLRDAQIGSAIIKEVSFQDLVDFSRMTVGRYGQRIYDPSKKAQWEEQRAFWAGSPLMHFENNTFAQEADFLHLKLHIPVYLTRNRFRSTFDLTGTTFETQHTEVPNATKVTPRLCLSYNRIHRLVFESKHLDRVKSVVAPECQNAANAAHPSNMTDQRVEPLASIYKSLERAFSDANDRRGVNEAWYLAMVAERDHKDGNKPTIVSMIWANVSWLFGDLPSRYTVDVCRTVVISVLMIITFALVYLFYFLLFEEDTRPDKTRVVMIPAASERHRGFRLRLFESIHGQQEQHARGIQPFRDAIALSVRAFTNLGMGTIYPNERHLRWLTNGEWALGLFMLIHFILAVRNNLPFILPFLGVVN